MCVCVCVCVCVRAHTWAQSLSHFSILWDPMDHSLPGSSVHGVFQTRILERVAIFFSRGSSWPRGWTCISCIGRWFLYHWATWEALTVYGYVFKAVSLGINIKPVIFPSTQTFSAFPPNPSEFGIRVGGKVTCAHGNGSKQQDLMWVSWSLVLCWYL